MLEPSFIPDTPDIDWDDPAARLALLEQLGPTAYNEALAQHREEIVVEVVNGFKIRSSKTRFGTLLVIGETGLAYETLEEARQVATDLPVGA